LFLPPLFEEEGDACTRALVADVGDARRVYRASARDLESEKDEQDHALLR
jgi:hypothetical protein